MIIGRPAFHIHTLTNTHRHPQKAILYQSGIMATVKTTSHNQVLEPLCKVQTTPHPCVLIFVQHKIDMSRTWNTGSLCGKHFNGDSSNTFKCSHGFHHHRPQAFQWRFTPSNPPKDIIVVVLTIKDLSYIFKLALWILLFYSTSYKFILFSTPHLFF